MYLNLLDIDKFIEKHKVLEVKNANYPGNKGYDEQSLWSETIFGKQNSGDRLKRFGYVNLHTKIINPLLYKLIQTTSPTARDIILSKEKYLLQKGKFTKSDEGETGIPFLLKSLNNFKFTSMCKPNKTKEADYLDSVKKSIPNDKVLIIPAGVRDIFPGAKKIYTTEINDFYSYLVFLTNQLALQTDELSMQSIIENVQKVVLQIHSWVEMQLKGKGGIYRGTVLKKVIDYSARFVATGSPKMPLGRIGIPWHSVLILFEPFFFNYVFHKDPILKEQIALYLNKEPDELQLNDVKRFILSFIKSTKDVPSELKELLIKAAKDISDEKQVLCKRDPVVSRDSYYAGEIEVLSSGKNAVLSTTSCTQQNLDFDGDQVAIIPIFTTEANEQAKKMNPTISKSAWVNPINFDSNNYVLTLDAIATIYSATQ